MSLITYIPNFTDITYDDLFQALTFEQRSVTVYGKSHPQPRLTQWYAPIPYSYSNLSWDAQDLPPILQTLQADLEELLQTSFPSCLANLYRDGNDKVGWHSDNEPVFGTHPVIASLSFGAARDFKVRHNDTKETETFTLEDQSLIVMHEGFQATHQHCLPPRKRVQEPRINLTFRTLRDPT